MKFNSCLTSYPNFNSRWIMDLNVEGKASVFLEDSMGKSFWTWGIKRHFKTEHYRANHKEKLYKSDYITIKKFCLPKSIINTVKFKPEDVFNTCILQDSHADYKELLQINKKNTECTTEKWARNLSKCFIKGLSKWPTLWTCAKPVRH